MIQEQKGYILGIIQSLGSFSFSTDSDISGKRLRIPTFYIKIDYKNRDILEFLKRSLRLKNKIYEYHYPGKTTKRNPQVMLIIRDVGQLKNIIVPLCYKNLLGERRIEFESWLKEISHDPSIPDRFRIIAKLVNSEFFERI